MILSMKLISIAFDMDTDVLQDSQKVSKNKSEEKEDSIVQNLSKKDLRKRKFLQSKQESANLSENQMQTDEALIIKVPSLFEYFGYALCPGTTVFGPWVPYKEYLAIFVNPRWNPNWMLKIIFTTVVSFLFLTISTCWVPWFIPDMKVDSMHKWLGAYRDAMSFRASHYFVSYLSEASAVTAGFGFKPPDATAARSRWELTVTEPHNIEVPRSLVEVVVSWNIPMHKWLKQYCFKKTVSYGRWTAVMTTFLASTFLHGFNFQLGAVLLSLGFFTFIEDKMRSKLASLFSASIEARRPRNVGRFEPATFRYREGSLVVMLANGGLGILTVIHLMYLGVMFDQSEVQTEGYRWNHTIDKWESLGFFSHYFMLAAFLLSFFL